MTSEKAATPAYSGAGYWATQIIACAVMFLICVAAIVLIVSTSSGEADSYGQSFMLGLTALLFLGCMTFLLVKFSRQSAQERAVYAWVIMQQHRPGVDRLQPQRGIGNMRRAAKGVASQLTLAEIEALQALRPDVPYPGTLPVA